MTRMSKSDWKLIGIGAVVAGALIIPVFQLIRMFSGKMAGFVDYEDDDATGEGRPVRRVGNVINICIMGAMATTRVNKIFPGVRAQDGKKAEVPAAEQSHSPSFSLENWRL